MPIYDFRCGKCGRTIEQMVPVEKRFVIVACENPGRAHGHEQRCIISRMPAAPPFRMQPIDRTD